MSSFATFFASAARAPDRLDSPDRPYATTTCIGFLSSAGDSPSPRVKCRTLPDASFCAGPLTLFASSGERRAATPADGVLLEASPNSSIAFAVFAAVGATMAK